MEFALNIIIACWYIQIAIGMLDTIYGSFHEF